MVQLGSGAQSARKKKLLEKKIENIVMALHYDPYKMTFNTLIL